MRRGTGHTHSPWRTGKALSPRPKSSKKGEGSLLGTSLDSGQAVMSIDIPSRTFLGAPRVGNRVQSTCSHGGVSPQAWESPFCTCLSLGASLLALHLCTLFCWQEILMPGSDPTVCGGGEEIHPSAAARFAAKGPDSNVRPHCSLVSHRLPL